MSKTRAAPVRCPWCGPPPGDPKHDDLYTAYHDDEWGVPCHDDTQLFAMLNLEGAQAGLSWRTVLGKRNAYAKAFADWDARKIARFTDARLEILLAEPKQGTPPTDVIIRNRLKVFAARRNAIAFLDIQKAFGSFDAYLWGTHRGKATRKAPNPPTFVIDGEPVVSRCRSMKDLPASTPLSDAISADLKRRGMTFVGSTIIYAYLQAVGVVNDHLTTCFRHPDHIKRK